MAFTNTKESGLEALIVKWLVQSEKAREMFQKNKYPEEVDSLYFLHKTIGGNRDLIEKAKRR